MNNHTESLKMIDEKLNAVHSFLQASTTSAATAGISGERDEVEPDATHTIIKRMASTNPEVRAKSNYLQCLDLLGFPVTTSVEDASVCVVMQV